MGTRYIGDKAALIDMYRAKHRPALVSPQDGWYSVRPIREQIEQLCATTSEVSARVAMSADFGDILSAADEKPMTRPRFEPLDRRQKAR